MKLTFIGAAHEVTGSCHYLEACGKHILIDCGLEQGPDLYENQEIPINPSMIDYILLTHAHIDHSGKIPLLVKNGFDVLFSGLWWASVFPGLYIMLIVFGINLLGDFLRDELNPNLK